MFYQDSGRLNVFRRFGCYFFSLGRIAEIYSERDLEVEDIWEVYAQSVCGKYMDSDCFLKKPDKVLNLFFNRLHASEFEGRYIGWWNKDKGEEFWGGSKEDITDIVERYPYGSIYHFKLADYDPANGWLDLGLQNGKRYFKVIER